MNDETFVSLVQRGAGLTDIRSGTWLKKQTNLKVKRVIRLISRLWQRWIVSPATILRANRRLEIVPCIRREQFVSLLARTF